MHLGIIAKVSKLCNLRCAYCYEMDELGDPARMSLQQIEQMFVHLREYVDDWRKPDGKNSLEFIWHGGEPFAQPISYWTSILELQTTIFGGNSQSCSVENTIQSNLTLITPEHIPLLRRLSLGFSYDVINDLRITAGGAHTAELVEKQVEWLWSEGIRLGGIAVISRANIDRVEDIASYFLSRRIPFRALNIYQGKSQIAGSRDASLTFNEYLAFFKRLWALPIVQKAIGDGLWVDPLSTSTGFLAGLRNGRRLSASDEECAHREWALAVNTNGDVYSPGDCYNAEFCYGNIFRETLDEMLYLSEGRSRRIERTADRFRSTCETCAFYRTTCAGTWVSHATPEDAAEYRDAGGCYHKLLGEWIQAQKTCEVPRESLYLNLTYRCNSDCLFCAADIRYKQNPRNLSLDEVANHLGDKRYRRVELSGGEPTIHPRIVDIVRMCREHSQTVAMFTHGRQLQNLAFTRRLLEAGLNLLIIPLYGANAAEHDYTTNAPGSFAQTVAGFENLQTLETEFPFWVELKLLLTKATASRNRQIYRFARDRFPNGFHEVSICPLIQSRSTLDYKDDYCSPFEDLRLELFDLAQEIIDEARYELRIAEFPPCFFPENLLDAAHPRRHRPMGTAVSYADEHSLVKLSMKDNPQQFRGGVAGNALIASCRNCRYDNYCAGLRSPYFSTTYLQQFGESEFRPQRVASQVV